VKLNIVTKRKKLINGVAEKIIIEYLADISLPYCKARTDNIGIIDRTMEIFDNPCSLYFHCHRAKPHQSKGSNTAPTIATRITNATGDAEAIIYPLSLLTPQTPEAKL
jgi:hypothetical protein